MGGEEGGMRWEERRERGRRGGRQGVKEVAKPQQVC